MKTVRKINLLFCIVCFFTTILMVPIAGAADDTFISGAFFDNTGKALGLITNNPDFTGSPNIIEYCDKDLPLTLEIQAYKNPGSGKPIANAPNISIEFSVNSLTITDVTDNFGVFKTTLDVPNIESVAGKSQVTTLKTLADDDYNSTEVTGKLNTISCGDEPVEPTIATGLIYSEVINTEAAWIWNGDNIRVPIHHSELNLTTEDNIDAISLGDDPLIFSDYRFDFFVVDKNSSGFSGDVPARKASGKNIQRDLYAEFRPDSNRVCIPDLVGRSAGNPTAGDVIDAIDFGDHGLLQGDRVYFSLTPDSPTLKANGWGPNDILVAQYKVTGSTIKLYVAGSQINAPSDIDALSIHDHSFDDNYNPATDYIIYSGAGIPDIIHYGFGAPSGSGGVHTHKNFGLLDTDEIVSLEHKIMPCCVTGGGGGDDDDVPWQDCTIIIGKDLSFTLPHAVYQPLIGEPTNLEAQFKLFNPEGGKLLWEIEKIIMK